MTHSSPPEKLTYFSLKVIAIAAAVALLYYGQLFFVTLVVAVTIAFLLDPFVEVVMKLRLPRAVASFVVCAVGLLLLYLLGLGAYTEASVLLEDLPTYTSRLGQLVDEASSKLENAESRAYAVIAPRRGHNEAVPAAAEQPERETSSRRRRSAELPKAVETEVPEVRIRQEKTPILTYAYAAAGTFFEVGLMVSFVPFLVYFMLSWKDHFRRSYLHLFQGQDRYAASRSWEGIADMARAYVLGNFVLGVLLSVAGTLFFWVMKLPYFLLIGPMSGFLSLVPYIGLPLSMAPPFFVALGVYERLTPYLIIGAVVAFLHLLALNLLYPKVVGSRVHLNPLAVTVALMFFGMLWGGVGLLVAIPVAAGLKAVCDNVPNLQPYGRLLGD